MEGNGKRRTVFERNSSWVFLRERERDRERERESERDPGISDGPFVTLMMTAKKKSDF